jgi:antitoxin component HigA of HigAB toxin-antitoxin module
MSVETPQEEWTEDLFLEATAAHEKINVTDVEVADFAPRQDRRRANEILDEIRITSIYVYRISRYRDIVNFTYWATRCEIEQTETAALAREKVYLGKKALDEASLPKAREHYDIAWEKWAELFKKYPELANDDTLEDLAPHLNSYQVLLRQMDEELPSDFPLRDILDGKKAAAGEPAPRLPDRLRITPRTEAADAKDPVDAKEPDAKDADSKDADAKDADSKDADAKDADSKDADSKDADSKDADSKDADAEAASESAADSDPKQAAASKPEADQP